MKVITKKKIPQLELLVSEFLEDIRNDNYTFINIGDARGYDYDIKTKLEKLNSLQIRFDSIE